MVEREQFVDACALGELSAEQSLLVRLAGRPVGVLLHDGRPVAVLNDCPHYHGPLAQGRVRRGEIICPWHYFRFDLSTGKSMTNPRMECTLLPTRVEGDRVFVDVGRLARERA